MSETPAFMSAAEIAQAVSSRKISALAATEAVLARIAAHDKVLNAFTDVTADRARAKAKAVDAAIATGQPAGPLAGVPFAVKNLFDVQGLATRAGSKINRDLPPSQRDATLIERMEAAGAVLVGALNMGEYAYDFTGENAHDGPSRNPHDPTRMAGGSSGSSGSAVGGALEPIALGFIGSPAMNFYDGEVKKMKTGLVFSNRALELPIPGKKSKLLGKYHGKNICLGIRPEHITRKQGHGKGVPITAQVEVVEPMGNEIYLYCLPEKTNAQFVARVTAEKEPAVQEALDLFGGRVVDVREAKPPREDA